MIAASQIAGSVSADVVQKCPIACMHCLRTGTSKSLPAPPKTDKIITVSNGSYLALVGS